MRAASSALSDERINEKKKRWALLHRKGVLAFNEEAFLALNQKRYTYKMVRCKCVC